MSLLQLMLLTVLTVMTVLSALMVVSVRNLIHAGFWLLPFFLGIGGFYLILSLEFLFALQLLLYAGAVMVVVLFALMLTRDVMNPKVRQTNRLQVAAIASSASMMTFLIIVIYRHSAAFTTVPGEVNPDAITRQLGAMLLNEYVLPFELTSALLLSAMLGAIFLARSPKVEITPEEVQEEAADDFESLPLHFFVLLSAVLLAIGMYGLISRRNAIAVLMSIEVVMNAANLNFVAFWRYLHPQSLEGVVFVLVTITVAAAEVAVGMAVVLSIYRMLHTVNVDEVAQMRG